MGGTLARQTMPHSVRTATAPKAPAGPVSSSSGWGGRGGKACGGLDTLSGQAWAGTTRDDKKGTDTPS